MVWVPVRLKRKTEVRGKIEMLCAYWLIFSLAYFLLFFCYIHLYIMIIIAS